MKLFKTNTSNLFVLCTFLLIMTLFSDALSQNDELKINLGKAKDSKFKVTFIPPENHKDVPIQFRRYSRLCYFPLLKHNFISNPKAYNSDNTRIKVKKESNSFIPESQVSFWEYYIDMSKYPDYINRPLKTYVKRGKSAFVYPSLYYPYSSITTINHRISIKDNISSDSSMIIRTDFKEYLDIDEFVYGTGRNQFLVKDSGEIHLNLLGEFKKVNASEIQSIIKNIVDAFEKTSKIKLPGDFKFYLIEGSIEKDINLPKSAVYKNAISIIIDKSLDEFAQKEAIIKNTMWQLFRWISPIQTHDTSWENLNPNMGKHSIHLWYYESVSEYLSLICLIKNQLITESYFTQIIQKKVSTSIKEPSYSLIQLGKDFSTQEGKIQIKNNLKAYDALSNRGVVASLIMDIVLLNESNGNRGLLDKFLELHKSYNNKVFPTDSFLGVYSQGHSKEFKIVLEKYILGIDKFHFKSYFELIDWQFFRKGEVHKSFMKRGHLTFFPEIGKYVCTKSGKNSVGLEKGDVLLSINNDTQISTMDLNEIILPAKGRFRNENRVKLEIIREGKEMVLRGKAEFKAKVENDIIIPLFNPSSDGYQLRKAMIH